MNASARLHEPTVADEDYDADFYAWTQAQAALIRERRFDAVDWANVAEEIEDMGKSELHAVESLAFQVLVHLACLAFSPAQDPRLHWRIEIDNFRSSIDRLLGDSPSLRRRLAKRFDKLWPSARRNTLLKLDQDGITDLPADCPFTLEQVLDVGFVPPLRSADPRPER